METNPEYNPSPNFTNVALLYGNHFRFVIDGLPDLTFFAQTFTLPRILATPVSRKDPFSYIAEVGDHITFSEFTVGYLIDNNFKTYFSLFNWIKGYANPKGYFDAEDFRVSRESMVANPRPSIREIQKTHCTLTILQPDNDTGIVEISFEDVFPTGLSEVKFDTQGTEPPLLHTEAAFAFTDFDVRPLLP